MTVSWTREERPWAIARRFDHKTRSYGYLKTYWPAHALRFARGWLDQRRRGGGGGGERESRDPAEINQRILRPFCPPFLLVPCPVLGLPRLSHCLHGPLPSASLFAPFSPLIPLASSAREFLAKRITGRQRAAIKLSTFAFNGHRSACTWLLYVPIGDKKPGAIHRDPREQSGSLINGYRVSRESQPRPLGRSILAPKRLWFGPRLDPARLFRTIRRPSEGGI